MAADDLESRLENWGWANRLSGRGSRFCAAWARLAHAMEGIGWESSRICDEADAQLVTSAWRCCQPYHRQLLKMHYIENLPPWLICRKLCIRQRPPTIFDLEMARARSMIRQHLARIDQTTLANPEDAAYTAPRVLEPAIAEKVA